MPKTTELLKSLLTLLATEEGANLSLVKEKLVEMGRDVIGHLRQQMAVAETLDAGEDSPLTDRLLDVIEEIDGRRLESSWRKWLRHPELEEGCYLLSRFAYPDVEVESYQGMLDAMAEELSGLIKHERWPDGVLRVINHYIYKEKGFHGNTVHYYDPDNSYLCRVLDRRVGIPITLSAVYLLLARRLGLPITGIGMPSHFLVKCDVPGRDLFIDPFNEGQSLTKAECASFLVNSGYGYKEHYLQPVADREIIVRMMRNLLYIYGELKEQRRIRWLTRFVNIIQPDSGGPNPPDDPGEPGFKHKHA
jgi:regulator of sirC expression with transglutaminase-like and TPR domain